VLSDAREANWEDIAISVVSWTVSLNVAKVKDSQAVVYHDRVGDVALIVPWHYQLAELQLL
jgi:hypothetical protein